MKTLGLFSIFAIFGWALIAAAYGGWVVLTIAALGFALTLVFAGCHEKSWGDRFAWFFFGLCVVLIGLSFRTTFAESVGLGVAKAVILLLLVLFAWRGSRALESHA